ncbi:hypothetical protein AB851_23210 [Ralstonia pseudosolanacearum]|nr:hypothetical protein AB851_23210 [Ralstonia pseudosolanacearum]
MLRGWGRDQFLIELLPIDTNVSATESSFSEAGDDRGAWASLARNSSLLLGAVMEMTERFCVL